MGGTNDNFAITTTTGTYLCKIVVNTTIDDILAGLPFLRRIEEHGFTVAVTYLKTTDGRTAYEAPDFAAVVLPFLDGQRPVPSAAVNHEVGAALARLHEIPADGLPHKPHWFDGRYLSETLEVALRRHGADLMPETLRVIDSLRGFNPDEFPQVIIHGDVDPSNSLMTEAGIRFLDWQDVAIGAAIMDVAGTALGFCFVQQGDQWRFDSELYDALAEGYGSVRRLGRAEAEHLGDAMRYIAITQPVWSMSVWDQYHPGQPMIETSLFYWVYGMDEVRLPAWRAPNSVGP
jgi:Ser/Thr protein kinase RdoA (MazF antagonist)